MNKTFVAMLFATALVPAASFAQTAPDPAQQPPVVETQPTGTTGTATVPAPTADMTTDPAKPATTVASAGETFVTVPPKGAWRVADLDGKDVYGIDGEDIGEINDVIVGEDGQVLAVIVGVGGFLGIGEKDVAVAMKALKFGPGMSDAEVAAAGGDTTADMDQTGAITDQNGDGVADTVTPTPIPTPAPAGDADVVADVEIGSDALPTNIVLNVTREQLENAPAFRGIGDDVAAPMDAPATVPPVTAPAQ